MSVKILHPSWMRRADNLGRLFKQADRVSFDSIVGRAAVLDSDGRVLSVNEAWNRLGNADWVRRLQPGDNYFFPLNTAAASGDEYAQALRLGLSSVLKGTASSFSLKYPVPTDHGQRWSRVSITPLTNLRSRVIVVIHDIRGPEDPTDGSGDEVPDPGHLQTLADAIAAITSADCVLIFETSPAYPFRCNTIAKSAKLGLAADPEHDTEGSPCDHARVRVGEFVFCESGAQRRYPKAAWLRQMSANGLADLPLHAPDGRLLGHISVVHYTKLDNPDSIESELRVFAASVLLDLEEQLMRRKQKKSVPRVDSAEAFYKAVLNSLNDAIIIVDEEGRVVDANRRATSLIRRPASELIGSPASSLAKPEILREVREKGYWRGEGRIERSDGSEADVDASITAIEYEGSRTYVAVARDVTDKNAAMAEPANEREKTNAILDALPETIIRVRSDGICVAEPAGDGLGYIASQGPIEGRSVREIMPVAAGERFLAAIAEVIDTGEPTLFQVEGKKEGQDYCWECRMIRFQFDEVLAIIRYTTAQHIESVEASRPALSEAHREESRQFRRNVYHLTFRELAVLRLLTEGSTDKEIADKLCVSIFTVNKHVANILGKMQAVTRTEAAVRASRENLVA